MKKTIKQEEDQLELELEEEEQVEEEREAKPLMLYELHYSLQEQNGLEAAQGEAEATLSEDALRVEPRFDEPLDISLQEIAGIRRHGYQVVLTLGSGAQLVISQLGRKFEEFWGKLSNLHHQQQITDLLMQETLLKTFTEVGYSRSDAAGHELGRGECELRCYETALVIIPENGMIQRVPFSFISSISPENYRVSIELDAGEVFVFMQLGRQYDSFVSTLSGALNALATKTQEILQQRFPKADGTTIRRAAGLLRDGKAVCKAQLDAISPSLWRQLEALVEQAGAQDAHKFLLSLGHKDTSYIGVKRGLMGDLTGEYIWFLVPIYGGAANSPGNALAMEAVSDSGSKATYFFRIISRKAYAAGEDAAAQLDRVVKELNYSLYMINFRREPIYLAENKLDARYRYTLANLPSLRSLRERFIGRVIHSSPEQWQRDVRDLLEFNVSTQDDLAKWSKSR